MGAEKDHAGSVVGEQDFDEYAVDDTEASESYSPSEPRGLQDRAWNGESSGSRQPRADEDGIDDPIGAVHASCHSDFNSAHLGEGVQAKVPLFSHGTSSNSKWQCFNEVAVGTRHFRPVRTAVWNVPVELMDVDGKRFRHWSTPHSNSSRAQNIAAVLGMAFTGKRSKLGAFRRPMNHECLNRAHPVMIVVQGCNSGVQLPY